MIHIIVKSIDADECPQDEIFEVLDGPDIDLVPLVAEYAQAHPPKRHYKNLVNDLDLDGLVAWLCERGFKRADWGNVVAIGNYPYGDRMANQAWRMATAKRRRASHMTLLAEEE